MTHARRPRAVIPVTVLVLVLVLVAGCRKPVPKPGEGCRDVGTGTCIDGAHALTCRTFTWHLDACRGPNGCKTTKASGVSCDQQVAESGDACSDPTTQACAADGKELLRCDVTQGAGKMVPAQKCRGSRGCSRDTPDGTPVCDRGAVEAGDPCTEVGPGSTCGADGHTLLKCSSWKKMVVDKRCRGAKGCFRSKQFGPGYWACDDTTGDVGESCGGVGNGGSWCSRDGKTVLTCKEGLLVRDRACDRGCTTTWAAGDQSYSVGCREK